MTRTPIIEMLENIGKTPIRFAMPGHKGRGGAAHDITELPGADNLYSPEGAIARAEELCAQEFGAARAMMSVCGSTACVLAMMGYFPRGSKIIMARDFHLSAKNGIDIFGIKPVFVEVETALGALQQTVSAEAFEKAISEHPDAAAVYLTYPNPYGMCADVERIARAAHEAGMTVLVDSAHGAHFGVAGLPKTAGELGADIWSVSFHKTLPALNQAAVLFCSENADGERLKASLRRVTTTSPSYPILASIDYARAWKAQKGEAEYAKLISIIEEAKLNEIEGVTRLATDDPTRIVLDVRKKGGGAFVEEELFKRGIAIESSDAANIVLITAPADTAEDFAALKAALNELPMAPIDIPEAKLVLSGGGAGESVFAYPPGIPIALSKAHMSEEEREYIALLKKWGYNIIGD